MYIKKLLSVLLICCIGTTGLCNNLIYYQTKAYDTGSIPAFPEDSKIQLQNWAETKWDSETVLPEDKQNYQTQYDKLIKEGKYQEAKELQIKKTPLYDDTSLNFYKVPSEIQKVVSNFYKTKNENSLLSVGESTNLKEEILKVTQNTENTTSDNQTIADTQINNNLDIIEKSSTTSDENIQKFSSNEIINTSIKEIPVESTDSISLQSEGTNLIDYYNGIEKNKFEYGLYSLIQRQNEDGSIGNTQKATNTYEFIQMLEVMHHTDNIQYQKAVNYFKNLVAQNNIELIYQIDILSKNQLDYSIQKNILDNEISDDGSIGVVEGYNSDLFTTIQAGILYGKISDAMHYTKILNYLLPKIGENGELKYQPNFNNNSLFLSYKIWEMLNISNFEGKDIYVSKLEKSLGGLIDMYSSTDLAISGRFYELKQDFINADLFKEVLLSRQSYNGLFGSILTSILVLEYTAKPNIIINSVTNSLNPVHGNSFTLTAEIKNTGYKEAYNPTIDLYGNYTKVKLTNSGKISTILLPNTSYNYSINFSQTYKFKGKTRLDYFISAENDTNGVNKSKKTEVFFATTVDKKAKMPDYFSAYSHEISNNGYGFSITWKNEDVDPDLKSYAIMYRYQGESNWHYIFRPTNTNGALVTGFHIGDKLEVTMGSVSNGDNLVYSTQYSKFEVTQNSTPKTFTKTGSVTNNGDRVLGTPLLVHGYDILTDDDGNFSNNIKEGINIIKILDNKYEPYVQQFSINQGDDDLIIINTSLRDDVEKPIITQLKFDGDWILNNQVQRNVYIETQDNIGVNNVELYYFNPTLNNWIYIDNILMNNASSKKYLWNIDNGITGGGFKIKAVAYDYIGNKSDEKEFGPFDIVNDVFLSLEKSTVNLGENLNYSVNIKPDSIYTNIVDPYLVFSNSRIYIKKYLANLGQQNQIFQVPFRSDFIGNDLYFDFKICNTDNTQCVNTQSSKFAITDVPFVLQSPWIDKGEVGFSLTNGDYNRVIHYSGFDAKGAIEIVYADYNKYTGRDYQFIYRKFENGVWLTPIILKTLDAVSGDNYENLEGIKVLSNGSKLGITYNNRVVKVGIDYNTLDDLSEVFGLLVENNTLKWSKQISTDTTRSDNAEIAFDSNGNTHFFWMDGYSYKNATGIKNLKTKYVDINGNLTNLQELTINNGYNAKGFLNNGDLYVGYVGYVGAQDKYYIKKFDSISKVWSSETMLFTNTLMFSHNIFIIDVNGETYYDIFYNKFDSSDATQSNYNLHHKKIKIVNGISSEVFDKKITFLNSEEEMNEFFIFKNNNNFDIIYSKRLWGSNRNTSELRHLVYDGNNILSTKVLLSPTTKLVGNIFVSNNFNKAYIAYQSQIGQVNVMKYLYADLTQVISGNSQTFIFPNIDINFEMTLSKVGISFIIEGYKITFWIEA